MAATGPEDRAGPGPDGTAACPVGRQACVSKTKQGSNGPGVQHALVYGQSCVQAESGRYKSNLAAPLPVGPTMHLVTAQAPYSFRSPESVEMDEIMAAMVLTSLSCSPVVQSSPQTDPGPAGSSSSPADMECGGGELSDSGSSGYWSWDHGNVSPAPSPSVTEMDSSPDEGLHMELEQGEELAAKKPKSSVRSVYRCLWPSCGKVLTSSVGIKRHIRVLHLGGSDQSQREEDFYYTKISCDTVDPSSGPAPAQQALGQASSSHLSWASCGSPPGSELLPAHRPRSNSSSGPGLSRPSQLSQSAPSSFWQIHSEHLYQACSPVLSVAPRSPGSHGWTASTPGLSHSNTPVGLLSAFTCIFTYSKGKVGALPCPTFDTVALIVGRGPHCLTLPPEAAVVPKLWLCPQMVKPRCRSVSVGEQWLQQNRLQPMSVSPSCTHCSFRKGRGEAKKCRKVYGVERKDQWCTACRWKKACQRFPD
uniref:Zinc finger protein 395b n=1 Tax=Haplochromis burtoni TaxID=8153 RepID=A0A3Q3CQ74_HAPBU